MEKDNNKQQGEVKPIQEKKDDLKSKMSGDKTTEALVKAIKTLLQKDDK